MHTLRISLLVDSEESFDTIRELLTEDLSNSLDGKCQVVNISHCRELASAFAVEQSARNAHTVLTPQVSTPFPACVTAVLQRFPSIVIPKSWSKTDIRVPDSVYGEIQGLPTLRGKIVLTNGVMAFLVREDGHIAYVHWNHFIPDRKEMLDDLPPQRVKRDKQLACLEDI